MRKNECKLLVSLPPKVAQRKQVMFIFFFCKICDKKIKKMIKYLYVSRLIFLI